MVDDQRIEALYLNHKAPMRLYINTYEYWYSDLSLAELYIVRAYCSHSVMEAVGNTANISNAIFQFLVHAQKAREFEDEFERHQLRLDILQVRLSRQIEALRTISNVKSGSSSLAIQANEKLCSSLGVAENEERSLAEIIAAVQHTLSKAQRDATKMRSDLAAGPLEGEPPARLRTLAFLDRRRLQTAKAIGRMQWAIYKRDRFDRSLADIAALVADLEKLANNEQPT